MQSWVERAEISSKGDVCVSYARNRSLHGVMLSSAANRCSVHGGAPYLYDDSQGVPQYDADDADTHDTYPC